MKPLSTRERDGVRGNKTHKLPPAYFLICEAFAIAKILALQIA